eukprot:1278487-Amphidinium_carterae.1
MGRACVKRHTQQGARYDGPKQRIGQLEGKVHIQAETTTLDINTSKTDLDMSRSETATAYKASTPKRTK